MVHQLYINLSVFVSLARTAKGEHLEKIGPVNQILPFILFNL